MPPVVAVHRVPSLTQERYEEVVRRLTKGKNRLESLSDLPFDGLLVHATAQTDDGFLVFDVFESEQAVTRFNKAMETIPREGRHRRAAQVLSGAHFCRGRFSFGRPR